MTTLLIALLGIAGSLPEMASAAEEKQVTKTKKHVKPSRHERKEITRPKSGKKRIRHNVDPLIDWWCDGSC
jgi:hypothetical protein